MFETPAESFTWRLIEPNFRNFYTFYVHMIRVIVYSATVNTLCNLESNLSNLFQRLVKYYNDVLHSFGDNTTFLDPVL